MLVSVTLLWEGDVSACLGSETEVKPGAKFNTGGQISGWFHGGCMENPSPQ